MNYGVGWGDWKLLFSHFSHDYSGYNFRINFIFNNEKSQSFPCSSNIRNEI